MKTSRSWMIAAAVAALLAARAHRAADDTDTARHEAAERTERYGAPMDPGAASHGAGAGEHDVPIRTNDAGMDAAEAGARHETNAERAARRDAEEVAAGNTGGRG